MRIERCACRQLPISIGINIPPQDAALKLSGRRLALTCELVAIQMEDLQRAQLSDALRDRACMYRKVRESSVVGFD